MTSSEAIEKMKNMRLFMHITDENSEHKFTEDYYKANEMAIQALAMVEIRDTVDAYDEYFQTGRKQQ